ncbi:hypothetical protein [Paraburkholderia sp. J11-2]|uniref:hypothetical protein n=1 Tax=Paraburkholderia sp. J11-2 TaxID=2805431 RepID=UPI002AB67CAC|nr:hypothetical protein [Paraburkholderia sp. J11-2]
MSLKINSLHQWSNTALAVLALAASTSSAYSAWEQNEAKIEQVSVLAKPGDCPIYYQGDEERAVIGMCWEVTIANSSENRMSVVNYQMDTMRNANGDYNVSASSIQELSTIDGKPLALPINLDGGEAKRILVESPVVIDGAVNAAVRAIIFPLGKKSRPSTIDELQRALATTAHVDISGNSLQNVVANGDTLTYSMPSPIKTSKAEITFATGRGGLTKWALLQPGNVGAVAVSFSSSATSPSTWQNLRGFFNRFLW